MKRYDLTTVHKCGQHPRGEMQVSDDGEYVLADQALDKIDGLEADLESAVQTAFKRGATEWTRLNYPDLYARFNRK